MSKNPSNNTMFTDEELTDELREFLPEGSTLWTRVVHVSQTGMSRDIMPVAVIEGDRGPELINIAWSMLSLGIGNRPIGKGKHGVVRMSGCNMDMCYALTSALSDMLYGREDALTVRSI